MSGPGGANTNTQNSYVTVSTLPAAPTAGFTGTPTSGNAPLPVVFTDTSSGSFTNWIWSFGDGNFTTNSTGASANETNTYAAGSYTVTLTVSWAGGANTDTQTNYVTVSTPLAPVAGFTGTPTSGYAPLPVVFTDTSSGSFTNWIWSFGDGRFITNSTARANETNTYAAAGSYTVTLTVSGPGGANTDTQSSYVTVSTPAAPVAGFTGTPTSGYAPLPVVFTDASSGDITNWVWSFGNGHFVTNSQGANVTNIYAAAGRYTVSLRVSGPEGANTKTQNNYVTVTNPPAAPVAGFMGMPTSGYAPLPVVFTNTSTGSITNWVWNFGDGHFATNGTGANVTNTYAAAGSYTVSLTVTGPGGANTNTQNNYVIATTLPAAPVAGFTGMPTSGYAPLPVVFTNTSTGSITNWVWSFGDGHFATNGTGANVTNTYAAAGSYTVTLIVTGPGGSSTNMQNNYVSVSAPAGPPVAGFDATPRSGFAPVRVVFSNTSSGAITKWVWNFGNGHSVTNSTGANVTNLYNLSGKYRVTLTVTGPKTHLIRAGHVLVGSGQTTSVATGYISVGPKMILEHFSLAEGRLKFSGTNGLAGQKYRILASTDLINWVPVLTNTFSGNGSYSCTNLTTTNRHCFFRLVSP